MHTPANAPVLLCLGSINADFQMAVPRSLGAETLPAERFTRLSGGKAANRAFLARQMGVQSLLLGRVGADDLRDQALEPLRDVGVDLSKVSMAEGCATAFSVVAVPPSGKKSILLAGNANDHWDDASVTTATDAIGAAPAGSLLALDYEVPAYVVRAAADRARDRGFRVVIDPSWPDRVEHALLADVFAVAPNASEAVVLTGMEVTDITSAARAARQLVDLGPGLGVIKLEDGGCVFAEKSGKVTHVPAQHVDVVDTTGAGDAFTGALAVALLEGLAPLDAVLWGVAASHAAVTAWGSQPSYPKRSDIGARLPALASAVQDVPT